MSDPIVVELTASETHPLRLAVLRFDTVSKQVVFPQDEWPGVVHLGLRLDGELVGTSTWVPREHDGEPAVQLRGMATARNLQGHGLGGILLEAGCARHAAAGTPVVWANARDAALAFYQRHGFVVVGDGWIDETTQLPHHLVLRRLA
ncbi:MAG: GNAT family N-acetyltransferase [Ilumatobacteraceae bacterium]